MAEKLFSFIVKDSKFHHIIDSLLPQTITDWECFVIDDNSEYIQKIATKDNRFHIVKKSEDKIKDINSVIHQVSGQYVMILNSNDYFVSNALDFLQQMIIPTMANIVACSSIYSEIIPESLNSNVKYSYRYLIRKATIMNNMFDPLSEFCFKKEYIQKIGFYAPEEVFIFNTLANIDAITKTGLICILQRQNHLDINSTEYKTLIDNFIANKNSFNDYFWKDYFYNVVPRILTASIYQHDKQSIKYCAKKIPMKYIPWKYKFMFMLLKTINM